VVVYLIKERWLDPQIGYITFSLSRIRLSGQFHFGGVWLSFFCLSVIWDILTNILALFYIVEISMGLHMITYVFFQNQFWNVTNIQLLFQKVRYFSYWFFRKNFSRIFLKGDEIWVFTHLFPTNFELCALEMHSSFTQLMTFNRI